MANSEFSNTDGDGFVDVDPALNAGPRAYAMIVDGDCVAPAYSHGQVVVCDPDARPQGGDFVVILWREFNRAPVLKRLVMGIPPEPWGVSPELEKLLLCETLKPPRRFSISLDKVAYVHKVLGSAKTEAGTP